MIKPQELRYGNWVRTKTAYDKPTEIQVHSIGASGINLRVNSGVHENDIEPEILFDDLEGIVLTEKHLLAWGFEKVENKMRWLTSKPKFSFIKGAIEIGSYWIGTANPHIQWVCSKFADTPFLFVHQLQNLFYDLTDTELS